MSFDPATTFKEIILNARQPIVLKDVEIDWECFKDTTLSSFCNKLNEYSENKPICFEKAPRKWSSFPQWERFREHEHITFEEFSVIKQNESKHWYSFSYKGLSEIPEPCRKGIDFSFLGFPNAFENLYIWLSSEGCHTPCHYDTYGCNIIVQIYGVKRWLLFPPNSSLSPTRVPYEESSVYSYENFFSPNKKNIFQLSRLNCMKVDLLPGNILIVPNHWWHYVETVESSLSINYWVPLFIDIASQIDECIVKFIIESFSTGFNDEERLNLLNPNQIHQLMNNKDLLKILAHLLQKPGENSNNHLKFNYQYLNEKSFSDLRSKTTTETIPVLTKDEFLKLLRRNSNARYCQGNKIEKVDLKEKIINAICNPDNVKNMREYLLKDL